MWGSGQEILTTDEARDILRLDSGDNDDLINALIKALPSYLAVATGCNNDYLKSPLAKTVAGFLIQLWYNADGTDTAKLQRTIDNLLTALTVYSNG